MTSDKVVPIFSVAPVTATGKARCLGCGHSWEAETPIGAIDLPCPECSTNRGVLVGLCAPEHPLICECENDLFFVEEDTENLVCAKCGRIY